MKAKSRNMTINLVSSWQCLTILRYFPGQCTLLFSEWSTSNLLSLQASNTLSSPFTYIWWSCFLFQGGNRSNLKRFSTVKSISLPAFVATFYYSSDLCLLLISTPAMCTGSQIWVDTTPGACSCVYPLLSFIIRVLLFTVSLPPTYKLSNFPQLKKYKHKQKTFLP